MNLYEAIEKLNEQKAGNRITISDLSSLLAIAEEKSNEVFEYTDKYGVEYNEAITSSKMRDLSHEAAVAFERIVQLLDDLEKE